MLLSFPRRPARLSRLFIFAPREWSKCEKISEDCFLITDLDDKNEYTVSKVVLNREYKEITSI